MLLTVFIILASPFVSSQTLPTLQPGFGQALQAVQNAESAGASPSDIANLVSLLNKALDLNREALMLNGTDDSQTRAYLLAQVNQTLTAVQTQATQLETNSSQKSYMNRMLNFVWGAMAAVVGTVVFAFIISFRKRYRIKRTFHMRISLK
jgi:hypothetical protein